MRRVVFLNDILGHSPNNGGTSHFWLANILDPAISMACGKHIELFINLRNQRGELFDREKFFALSDIYNVSKVYYLYDISAINQNSWDYLYSFINEDDLIIGIEMGLDLRRELTKKGISFINFWFHSFKLFDDICFMLNTNNKAIFKRIEKYKIPREKFELYATVAKIKLGERSFLNSRCLFVGQCMRDVSVKKDDHFLNITDFPEEIEQLGREYGKICYISHPADPVENHSQLVDFINKRPYIQVLKNVPSYVLLCSSELEIVVGVSSSLLYEAQFFGKKVRYLYRPLFDIDNKDFGENNYLSVYNDYLNPAFWVDILEGFFDTNKSAANAKLFDVRQSMLRGEILNNYHAYEILDKVKTLQIEIEQEKQRGNAFTKLFDARQSMLREEILNNEVKALQIEIEQEKQRGNALLEKISHLETEMENIKGKKQEKSFKCRVLQKLFRRDNDPELDITKRYVFGLPVYERNKKNVRILGLPIFRN